jgi:hypothetical protein
MYCGLGMSWRPLASAWIRGARLASTDAR